MQSTINIPQEKLIPNSQVTEGKFLGQGGYGRVYRSKWKNDTVAVKRLILEKMNPQAQAEFSQKIGIDYQSPKLIEAATCILMEYVSKGTRLYSDSPLTNTRCQEKK